MTIRPFETLSRLRQRMAEAIVAQSGVRNPALAAQLRQSLSGADSEGALVPHMRIPMAIKGSKARSGERLVDGRPVPHPREASRSLCGMGGNAAREVIM